jgi:hypothetical protein
MFFSPALRFSVTRPRQTRFVNSVRANLERHAQGCRTSAPEDPDRKSAGDLRRRVLADYENLVAKNLPK